MKRALCVLTAVTAFSLSGGMAMADVVYNSIPSPLPGNVPSLGYQANQTAEFGNEISLAGTSRLLTNVTITMSDWAKHSDYPAMDSAGYTHPITINLYNVAGTAGNPQVGSLLATVTQNVLVPWYTPTPDFSGIAFNVNFDFSSLAVTLPDTIIYGVAFNTNTWGYSPIGLPGPYESLNFGLATSGPSVGTDVNPGDAFWNTMTAANYSDGGAGGTGTFRPDTNWAPYTGAIEVNAEAPLLPADAGVPLPAAAWGGIVLLGSLIGAKGLKRLRRQEA